MIGNWSTISRNLKNAGIKFYSERYIEYWDFPELPEFVYDNFFKIFEIHIPEDGKQPIELFADSMFEPEHALYIRVRGTRCLFL